jgi:2-oxoglutarate dehydrogenase E1 component
LVMCTGKIAIDLEAAITAKETFSWLHVVRVEQLYPLPENELQQIIARFHNLKELVWLQEEPQNMGAWTYIGPRLRMLVSDGVTVHYIGRPERASTASGYQNIHKYEQAQMIESALKPTNKQNNATQK